MCFLNDPPNLERSFSTKVFYIYVYKYVMILYYILFWGKINCGLGVGEGNRDRPTDFA